jgi:uncharacterized protein YbjT (DUF2867 family)
MGKRALVAGATGLVGSHLLTGLFDSAEYSGVVALVRRPIDVCHPKLTQVICDFDNLADCASSFDGVDDVFCTLGTTIKKAGSQEAFRRVDCEYPLQLARLSATRGVNQYLLVSAMGADEKSRIFYNHVKGEVERSVQELGPPYIHIFRPSLLLGDRTEVRIGEKLASILMTPLSSFLVGSLKKYRPIPAAQVALAMIRAAQMDVSSTHIYLSDEISNLGRV